ncbi:hypothetical protein [Arthrobacter sp. NPDC056493]|uniref:hypothetical protein n=1 Tax=Arthrobacter sp. NPDC056493 TaxID=3345839 RepID=UPI00366BE24E
MQEYCAPKLIGAKAPLNCLVLPAQALVNIDGEDGVGEIRATLGCDRTNLRPTAEAIDAPLSDWFKLQLERPLTSMAITTPWGCELWNTPSNKGRDTPDAIRGFDNKNRLDSTMALRKLAQGGRPSKGPRHTFNVKPDITRAEKLRDILDILDCNAVDYLTPLVAAHIDSIDLEKFRAEHTQEILPIAQAS